MTYGRSAHYSDVLPRMLAPSHLAEAVRLWRIHAVCKLLYHSSRFTFGFVSDNRKIPLNALIATCASVAAVATLGLWGLASSWGLLAGFAILYGFFGAGYTAMWARMVTAVSEEPLASQPMFGLFCAGKGVGNILTGPISAGLLKWSEKSTGYAHGMYEAVVVFTGVCLIVSAASLGTVYLRPKIQG